MLGNRGAGRADKTLKKMTKVKIVGGHGQKEGDIYPSISPLLALSPRNVAICQ